MVIHGFRSLFCSVLNESNLFNHVIIERQLAHVPQNRIRSAYNRAQYLEEAVRLMGWYGIKVKEWISKLTDTQLRTMLLSMVFFISIKNTKFSMTQSITKRLLLEHILTKHYEEETDLVRN